MTETDDRLIAAAATIGDLRYRYLLAYEPENSGWKEIRVQVARPGVTVHARKGYYPRP